VSGKLVQIIAADGWFVMHEGGDEMEVQPLIAWGLTDAGVVVPLVVDPKGGVTDPRDDPTFGCITPCSAAGAAWCEDEEGNEGDGDTQDKGQRPWESN